MSAGPDYLEKEMPNLFHAASVSMSQDALGGWKAVAQELAEAFDAEETSEAVLAAYGQGLTERLRDRVVAAIRRDLDGTYPAEGRDRELEALSTAIVVHGVTSLGGIGGTVSALGTLSAAFSGWESVAVDLPALAVEYLNDQGAVARRRRGLPNPPGTESTVSRPGGLKDVSWTTPMDVHPFAAAHASAIRALGKWIESAQVEFGHRQRLVDEELDLLWWAINGRSDILGQAWSDVPADARAVFAGLEAADRTVLVPGPPSAPTLIDRAIGNANEVIDVVPGVESVVALWPKDSVLEERPSPLLPVLTSLRVAQDLGGESAWRTVVERKHGIVLPEQSEAGALGSQTYRERLLLSVLTTEANETSA